MIGEMRDPETMRIALAAIFVQTLVPKRAGGRIAAAELLVIGYGARQHIRKGAVHHLHQETTLTRRHGSFTLEECLASLVKSGVVDRAEALIPANHPDDFTHALGQT